MKISAESLEFVRSVSYGISPDLAPATLDEALRLARAGRLYEVRTGDGCIEGLVEANSRNAAVRKMETLRPSLQTYRASKIVFGE